jgi:aminoglycoside phosphotransferase (APT) family kinase protein
MSDLTEETIPVREAHRFDEDRLASYLERRLPDGAHARVSGQMRGGQSNPTFLVHAGEAAYVLRKQPPGELLPSAHAVDREYRIIEALSGTSVPVPKPILFCAEPDIIGTPFYLMEHLSGRVFRDNALPGMTKDERAAIYDAMNDCLARLHRIDPQAAGLEGYGKPGNYFARQIGRWTKQWQASKRREIPELDRLCEWLPQNTPPGDRVTLIHGDYRLENLMFAPDRPEVIGILDWELSTLGHPLADLAYNCMIYFMHVSEFKGLGGLDLAALGIPDQKAYAAAYERRTGHGGLTEFHLVFSMFRMSVILEGVYARGLAGNASSESATQVGAAGNLFAKRAWALVEGKNL